jgi:hypothetical protein
MGLSPCDAVTVQPHHTTPHHDHPPLPTSPTDLPHSRRAARSRRPAPCLHARDQRPGCRSHTGTRRPTSRPGASVVGCSPCQGSRRELRGPRLVAVSSLERAVAWRRLCGSGAGGGLGWVGALASRPEARPCWSPWDARSQRTASAQPAARSAGGGAGAQAPLGPPSPHLLAPARCGCSQASGPPCRRARR